MHLIRVILISQALGCAFFSSEAWSLPAQVMMIRHAEKPDQGPDLSPRGYERAQKLASYFIENLNKSGPPVAIYAMPPSQGHATKRPMETVAPLATRLAILLNTNYTIDDIGPLAQEILTKPQYNGKSVLICWEHKRIPQIAQALGAQTAPSDWGGDVFDQTWVITYSQSGIPNFSIVAQHLLPGDSL